MSLRRHVCCRPLRLPALKDNIWISEHVLNNAMQRFAPGRVPRRHVGLAPGPLEARKRATRRRMMNLAQAGDGGFDPSVLPRLGAPECVGWKWQSPKPLTPQKTYEVAPLSSWLAEPPLIETDERFESLRIEEHIQEIEKEADSEQPYVETERKHPMANPTVWEDFKKCRDVDGLHNWAATHGVNVWRYPKLLFARLCYTGQPLPLLLHALEDPALGSPGNFNFLLDWQLRKRKGRGRRQRLQKRIDLNDMALLQQWMKRQLYLGLKSEEDIHVFLRFVSRVIDATSDESLRDNFITSFEGLQSSSVFGFKDLGTETQHRILEVIVRGSVTRQLLELGFSFVKAMPYLGLESTDQKIAAFITSVFHAHASLQEHDEKPENPFLEVVSTILDTIWQLPRKLACSAILITTKTLINDHLSMPAIKAATMQLPDTWLAALAKKRSILRKRYLKSKIENFLGAQEAEVAIPYLRQLRERKRASFILRYWVRPRPRFRRYQAWYLFPRFPSAKEKNSPRISRFHAVHEFAQGSTQPLGAHIRQVFKTLQMLRLSESIGEIIKQARKLDAIIDESDVVYIIREHLGEHPQLAERFFHFYPRLRLEKCPELAERMILNPESNPEAAIRYLLRKESRCLVHRDQFSRRQVTQPRIHLLGRMAIAYSKALHLNPRRAFRFIHDCYTLHTRERLGPISVAIARAFTRAGVIRPLQGGHWVSTAQVRWILSVIRSTEGTDVADRVDETVYKWRGTNVRRIRTAFVAC